MPASVVSIAVAIIEKLHFPFEDAQLPERPGSIVTALVPGPG
jgi:hypothetical protein